MNQNLVKVNKKKLEVLIDLRYSTSKNFTKERVFLSNECYIHKVAYEHLDLAVHLHELIFYITGLSPKEVISSQSNYGFFKVIDNSCNSINFLWMSFTCIMILISIRGN